MAALQVLDAVSGALIGAFTWWNLGFVAPALAHVYRHKLPVSPHMLTVPQPCAPIVPVSCTTIVSTNLCLQSVSVHFACHGHDFNCTHAHHVMSYHDMNGQLLLIS